MSFSGTIVTKYSMINGINMNTFMFSKCKIKLGDDDSMKVLLINPPRYLWRWLQEEDSYLLPQALPCLAAVLREAGVDVKPIDCLPLKIGWKSLERIIRREQPDIVGAVVSESMYSSEALKLCRLVKEIDPKIFTVVGGPHFSNLVEETLQNNFVDFVVIGEGEYTLLELVKETEKLRPNFKKIKGIGFRNKYGKVVITRPRPLIENLDELPLPAYDLMPMKEYGKSPLIFSPTGATIHHSRGCMDNCNFCVCWKQMAERRIRNKKMIYIPRWRTKSVERTLEEIELLYRKYKKWFLTFTDDTWNTNPKWNMEFTKEVKEHRLEFQWFAFMRADFILRDEKLGIFKNLVESGLAHVFIGAERACDAEFYKLNKKNYSVKVIEKCSKLLNKKYPQIFTQASFIVGLRDDDKKSIIEIAKFAKKLDIDYPSLHPLMPIPGTEQWEIAKKNGWLEINDFSLFNWVTPVMSTKYLSRDELEELILLINRGMLTHPKRFVHKLFSKYNYKRRMSWWVFLNVSKFLPIEIVTRIAQSLGLYKENWIGWNEKNWILRKPKWYDH
jgi:anaerobic magnesium-protoporphyrin IX monomethyl ester cyclase